MRGYDMAMYLFSDSLFDNKINDISHDDIKTLYHDNLKEYHEGLKMTQSTYRGESFLRNNSSNRQLDIYKEFAQRGAMTAGVQIYYPHGVVIEQSLRRNYYRGENQIYPSSVPTLLRTLRKYNGREEKELYRMISDMRIYEFSCLLRQFQHVQNWEYGDVLYEALAQHYGLETAWLDITSDFNVALFFACCEYQDGKWRPLTKEQTEKDENHQYGMIFHMPSGVMAARWASEGDKFKIISDKVVKDNNNGEPYRNEELKYPLYTGLPENLIYPLGFQPFMRCHMQNGYGIYMRAEKPLQLDTGIEKLRFRHSEELSNWIYQEMKGGELIYPHEGLKQVEYLIQQIRTLKTFSEGAFLYALQRNHLFTISDKDEVLSKLEKFIVDGEVIKIQERSTWHLTPLRRTRIDNVYRGFSLYDRYGIQIITRNCFPKAVPMFEPWMLLEQEDEPGIVDFEVRKKLDCETDIHQRSVSWFLETVRTAKLQDF